MADPSTSSTAEFKFANADDDITVGDIKDWFNALPEHAKLKAITRDVGGQRDPWMILVGLRARWEG